MVYNTDTNPWQCECSDGWTRAGSECVPTQQKQDLLIDFEEAHKVRYYDLDPKILANG